MKPDRYGQIEELYHAALERVPAERSPFLEQACGGDEDLRHEVESLLAYDARAEDFIEAPPDDMAAAILAAEREPALLGRTLSHYHIVSLLGTGGMGQVYLAEDTQLNRKVAIKVLYANPLVGPQGKRRIIREAQAAAALGHPNICAIHEVRLEGDPAFIVMEYVPGETLAGRMKRKPLALSEVLTIAAQVADALSEAHSRGIIHRDLKPQNIMITTRDQVKLLDFGLAKVVKEDTESDTSVSSLFSTPDLIVGTVPYMSPEQLRGETLDARSDIFSFGSLLFEMVCGVSPFASPNQADTVSAILTKDPPPLSQLAPQSPERLQRIVNKCLERDPRRRYQTMEDLAEDLSTARAECEGQQAIPVRISHYRILETLGEGEAGVVYLAQDTQFDRKVALKVLRPKVMSDCGARRRLIDGADAAVVLEHPNICAIHEAGEDGDLTFIAMQYVEGETLASLVQNKPLPLPDAIDMAIQIGEAIVQAHAHAIVHGDIKPANIMVTAGGRVKLMGFGLANLVREQLATQSGADKKGLATQPVAGPRTSAYIPPTSAGDVHVDPRTDIVSFAAVLYQMTTGTAPIEWDRTLVTPETFLNRPLRSLRKLNRELPAELERIIDKALTQPGQFGYVSAKGMLEDLRWLKRDVDSSGRKAKGNPALRVSAGRTRRLVGLGAVLGAVVVVAVLATWRAIGGWPGAGNVDQVRATSITAAIAAEHKHLVVLPFTSVGQAPANEAFCAGLAQTLSSNLAKLEQVSGPLWVVPASDPREPKVNSPDEARRQLGVNLALLGSVKRDDRNVQIALRLVDTKTLRQLGSAVIDDSITNLSMVDYEMLTKSARMLDVNPPHQMLDVLAASQTTVSAAYDAHLQGRGFLHDYNELPSLDAAIGSFNRALKEDPEYAAAYEGLSEAYWRRYKFTKDRQWIGAARSNCERALKLNNQSSAAYITLGIMKEGTGRYKEAVKEFRRALVLDPLSVDACNGLARAYDSMGKETDAEETYKRSVESRPDFVAGYQRLGRFYRSHGRDTDAVTQFARVVDLTPDNYRALNDLGMLYIGLERWPEAGGTFERSVRLEPNYDAFSNLGMTYSHQARYSAAARMYEKALELDSHDYKVWGDLAAAYHWLPNDLQAPMAYQRAIQMAEEERKVKPRDADVLSHLAEYYAMTGDRVRALQMIGQALEQSPGDGDVLFRAGEVYEHFGERRQAGRWIWQALSHGCSKTRIAEAPELARLWADPNEGLKGPYFGVASASFPVQAAAGKRLRYSGYIKTEGISRGWAGLWWRVDGSSGVRAFDNMQDRGVTGTTDWARYEIVLLVPADAKNIYFGALLTGDGTAWFDGLLVELDGAPYSDPKAFDLDFESPTPKGFHTAGPGYLVRLDSEVFHSGKQSLLMKYLTTP